jgi:LuxR family transcriptional regulator, maltose regulon positive regulatory protein
VNVLVHGRIPGVPRLPAAVVHRTALIGRLDDGVRLAGLVVVRGGVGTGKTVLVADWATHRADHRVAWVTADAALDDRRVFWEAVADAMTAVHVPFRGIWAPAGAGAGSSASDASGSSDVAGFRRSVVAAFAALDEHVTLVVDEAHLLRDVELQADLAAVVSRSGTVSMVLASRGVVDEDVRAPLRQLGPEMILPDDLMVSARDAADLVGRIVGHAVPASAVRIAVDFVRGHIGLLVAGARVLAVEGAGAADLTVRFHDAVVHAAQREVSALVGTGPLAVFVEATSVVERLPQSLAQQLSGVDELTARALLDEAESRGLGGWTVTGTPFRAFRYHPVVRAVALDIIGSRPAERLDLLRTVLEWARTNDDPTLAIAAAVDLGDLDALTGLLRAHWTRIVSRDRIAVARALGHVSLHRAAAHPVVLAAVARTSAAAGRHHARATSAHLATVHAVAAALPGADGADRVFLHAIDVQARRVVGDMAGALEAVAALRATLAETDGDDRRRLAPVLPYVREQLATTAFLVGDFETALTELTRIEPVDDEPDRGVQLVSAGSLAALVHALVGEVDTADRLLDDIGPTDLVTSTLAHAVVSLERLDPAGALELLDRVDPLFGAFEYWPIVLGLRALAAIVLGRVRAADQLAEFDAETERLRSRAPAAGVGARIVGLARVRLLLAAGQLHRVEQELEALGPVARWDAAEHASLWLVRDEPHRALDIVTATLVHAEFEPRASSTLVLLRAAAQWRLGLHDDAREGFAAAVDTLVRSGLRTPFLTLPATELLDLVEDAAARGDDRSRIMLDPAAGLRSTLPGSDETVILSERESVVLGQLARPLSLTAIAGELHVSVNTVKTQTRSLYRKLGAAGRREAVELAHALGLVVPE